MRLEIPQTIQTESSLISFALIYVRISENIAKPAIRIKTYRRFSEFEEIPPFELDPQIESEIFETIKSGICELLEKGS